MITERDLQAICPLALPANVARLVAPLNDAMHEFGINTPARQAAFLAQIGHESAQLNHLRELWGPLPVQLRYEGRADLGNTQPGDGFKFRGRGLIQITGRANYAAVGRALDMPLEDRPELLEQPVPACRSAGWFWRQHGLNELADAGDFDKITRVINGGTNGLQERLALYGRAQQVLA